MARGKQLENWEISIIRAMLDTRKYTKQQIVSYFTRPERSINQGRISEIRNNHERYDGILPASDEQLKAFLADWKNVAFPVAPKVDLGPVHQETLKQKFVRRQDIRDRLSIAESDWVEGKEKFDWGSREKYGKTLAGLANNKGGYLLFGVVDGSFEVVGISNDRMDRFDLKRGQAFLSRAFNQSLRVEKGSFVLGGDTIGVLYVHEAEHKPVICKADTGGLASGDIYYRYAGETRRIQAPELEALLLDRDKKANAALIKLAGSIQRAGVENSAILNLASGEVEGSRSRYILPAELLEKLKFIKEGSFNQVDGAAALRVIGSAEIQPFDEKIVEKKVKDHITERDILADFFDKVQAGNPEAYIYQLCHLRAIWLPIFYFARCAGFDKLALLQYLKAVETPYEKSHNKQYDRVKFERHPANLTRRETYEHEIVEILSMVALDVPDEESAKRHLEAMRLLLREEIDVDHLLSLCSQLYKRFGASRMLRSNFRYTAAYIDITWFGYGV